MSRVKRVVFKKRIGLRWYFIDTRDKREYFLSLVPKDIFYLLYGGIFFLLPPTNIKHIKGNWL